jgi:PHS family inorganic phosphate transporter-like MFS transporter
VTTTDRRDLLGALDDAPITRFHTKAIFTAGMGFFTDAYDLFIIGTASTLISKDWNLTTTQTGLINSMTLLGAFVGAIFYGRIADKVGRKKIYGLEAAIMLVAALASSFSPDVVFLIVCRFVLGLGVGGDYPVSAVLMSEFANRKDRGRLVALVFSMQAAGTVAGYVVGLALLSAGIGDDTAWRIMLALGAVPSAMVLYSRRRMPESPRFQAIVKGDSTAALASVASYSEGTLSPTSAVGSTRLGLGEFLSNRRYLLMLVGTAGSWFVFDYAYYGNSVSAPLIVKSVLGPSSTTVQALAFNLIVFSVAAVPGYFLAANFMDRIGHRRLQLIGFPAMGLAFLLIAVIPGVTVTVAPFLVLFGISYYFAEFGPNTTTFVLAAEVYPTSVRTTGHGISAGVAKLGAFVGVYLFPHISKAFGVGGALGFSAGMALIGTLLTLLIPEPSNRGLEEISGEAPVVLAAERVLAERQIVAPAAPGAALPTEPPRRA